MQRTSLLSIFALIAVAACATEQTREAPADRTIVPPPSFLPSVVVDDDIPEDIQRDSWGRLPLLNRSSLALDGQRAYDLIVNPKSRYASGPRGPVAMWLYSPAMAEHIFPASTYLRFGTEKDQRLTELTILATAREVRSQYEWSAHEPLALEAGLEPDIVEVVKYRLELDRKLDGLGEHERTIIQFTREVINQKSVSATTFTRAQQLFGDRGVMNLVGLIGYYNFVNLTLKAFDVQLAPGRTRLLPDLWSETSP